MITNFIEQLAVLIATQAREETEDLGITYPENPEKFSNLKYGHNYEEQKKI